MIDIRDIQGNIVKSVPITQSCQKIEELMVSDYIQLSWNSDSNEELQAGCYIEYNGEKFSLLEPYKPTQKNEVEFTYTPQFKSKVMAWSKVPFFFYTTNEDKTTKEPDWTLTSNPADFMKCVCDALKNETGEEWTYTIDASLPASASLSFNTVDIFSSLNEIASAFETEWYTDKINNIIYLGKASFGEPIILEVGENIKVPSVNSAKEGYYTRFYAFGSTRNITQDYEGSNVNNLVNKRLTLDPVKYPNGYKDIRADLRDGEIFSKVLVFEDVYPSSNLSISSVRNRLMYRVDGSGNKIQIGTDENGKPIYDQYAIWYFRINGFEFDTKNIIQGQTLSVHFQTGALAGREFELKYYESKHTITTSDGLKFEVQKGDYEILFVEEGNYIIPSLVGLVPSEGDEVVLFNIEMPSEYTQSAYDELEAELDKEIERLTSNRNNYSFNSNPVAFNENNPNLTIGRNVTYKNGDETLNTRVIKLTTQLDFPIEQNITIGNEKIKGNTQQLKEEVATANKDLNLLAVFNDMTSSLQQSYNRTQQMMLDGFAAIKNIWQLKEDENGKKYIYSAFNVATEGGISMYRNLGFSNIPSIYDGLPIDGQTIYWEDIKDDSGVVVGKILKAKTGGGTLGSLTNVGEWADSVADVDRIMVQKKGSDTWEAMDVSGIGSASFENISESGEGNAYTSFELSEDKKFLTLVKGETFSLASDLEDKWTTDEELINNWNTAFGWGNHAEAGYALQASLDLVSEKLNNFLEGSDTDSIINKWKELEVFLDGLSQSDNLAEILATKANQSALEETNRILATKWTKDDTKIANWDAAFSWGDHSKAGYVAKDYVDSTFVPIKGDCNIEGIKNFIGTLQVNGSPIVYDKEKGYWYFTGDMIVSGGITMFGNPQGFEPSTIMDGVHVDDVTITKENGRLVVLGGGGSGGSELDTVAWGNVLGKPSWITDEKPECVSPFSLSWNGRETGSYNGSMGKSFYIPAKLSELTDDVVSGKYLPLSGGTISNAVYGALNVLRESNHGFSGIRFSNWSGVLGHLGVGGSASDFPNQPTFIDASSNLYGLIHSGNIGSQSVSYASNAGKLKTPIKIWGQSFDGTGNVNGDIYPDILYLKDSNDANTSPKSYWGIYGWDDRLSITSRSSNNVIKAELFSISYDNGNVGIGITSPSVKLHVKGNIKAENGNFIGNLTGTAANAEKFAGVDFAKFVSIIPTNTNQLENGAGFITSSGYSAGVTDYYDRTSNISIGYQSSSLTASQIDYIAAYSTASGNIVIKDVDKSTMQSWLGLGSFAYKSSLAFSELTSKPTTISGYGITDAITTSNIGSQSVNYATSSGSCTGNAASATKLSDNTSYTAWGQTFFKNGKPKNVSGDIYPDILYLKDVNIANTSPKSYWGVYAWDDRLSITSRSSNNVIKDELFSISYDNGNVGIGITSPSTKLHVEGAVYATDCYIGASRYGQCTIELYGDTPFIDFHHKSSTADYTSRLIEGLSGQLTCTGKFRIGLAYTTSTDYNFYVNGSAYISSNLLTGGGITMYSARVLKNVVDERGLSLNELRVIKPTRYTWKDGRDSRLHFGGIADDIQQVLPEVVYKTNEGVLTMDYGNAAFAIASSLIKPVVDHEQRIKALERENELLKQELNRLRA